MRSIQESEPGEGFPSTNSSVKLARHQERRPALSICADQDQKERTHYNSRYTGCLSVSISSFTFFFFLLGLKAHHGLASLYLAEKLLVCEPGRTLKSCRGTNLFSNVHQFHCISISFFMHFIFSLLVILCIFILDLEIA